MLLRRCLGITKSSDENKFNYKISYLLKKSNKNFQFEYLPNELIFTIFDYFDYDDLLYSFNKLNSRFQYLLSTYQYYHLNIFQLIKFQFNNQHIKFLTIKNTIYSPINIEEYLSKNQIEEFYPKLQSLSLINIDVNQLISIIRLLPNFQQLKSLLISIENFLLNNSSIQKQIFFILLFQIKTLKYFLWDIKSSFFINKIDRKRNPQDKSSIEHYKFHSIDYSDLIWLKHHTINMKSIDICYPSFRFDYVQTQESFENLVTIKLNNISTYDNMKSFFEYFKYLKRLNQLELQGDFIRFEYFIDGYKWEYLIRKHIPQLTVFKFFFILSKWSMLRTIENLIQSFKTDFWLNEKKWFINCDYRAFFDRTYLYTIPYINKELKYSILCQQKSTRSTNESLYIEKLSIYLIKLEHLLFNDRLINTESVTINQIDDSLTYEQLSRFLNISSIKSIEFQFRINSRLFFDILKYHKTPISIEINDANLRDLLQRNTYHHHRYLNKMNQLILTSRKDFRYKSMIVLTRKDLENLCYYCINIKRLIIRGAINPLDLIYLLKKFKCLTFLMGTCYNLDELCNYNIRQWLINQRETTLDKRNFIWKWTEDILYIWID